MFILYLKEIKLFQLLYSPLLIFFLHAVEINDWLIFSMRTSMNGILPFSSIS